MSLSTALIGGIGGAIIGFFTGGSTGALQGLQVGTFVGGLIDANKSPTIVGPRLTDLTVQTSTYGAVIPRVYGTVAICGNVFWLENNRLKEVATTNKSGGKGGGGGSEYETYAYYATFALGLCQCPKDPLIGIKRIWIKGVLWYNAGSNDYNTIRVSNSKSELFKFYPGSDTQLPDDRMQATLGVANTPAYRGLAYIVFKDLPLRDYGNSLAGAQIKVELVSNGSIADHAYTSHAHGLPTATSMCWDGNQFIAAHQETSVLKISTSPDGITWTVRTMPSNMASANASISIASCGKFTVLAVGYQSGAWKSTNGISWIQIAGSQNNYWNVGKVGDGIMLFPLEYHGSPTISTDGYLWKAAGTFTPYGSFSHRGIVANSTHAVASLHSRTMIYVYTISTNSWRIYPAPFPAYGWGCPTYTWVESIQKWMFGNQAGQYAITSDFENWTTITVPFGFEDIYWAGDRVFAVSNGLNYYWSKDCIIWTNWQVPFSITCYNVCYNEGVTIFLGESYWCHRMTLNILSTTVPTLASVIQSECSLSKVLKSTDIDVSLLSQQVRGYVLSSVAALRSGLSPLQGKFQFDIIQSGYKIKFKPRGNSSVVTIPAKDLGAEGIT